MTNKSYCGIQKLIFYIEGEIMFYSQRHLNLHSFGVYTFNYYKSLGVENYDFEKKVLPVYLNDIMEHRYTLRHHLFGKTYLTYESDGRNIIGKVIDAVENKPFIPALFYYEKQRFYKEAAPLTLLAILSDSYHFANVNEPIEKGDVKLFEILMEKCYLEKFMSLSESFCLRESRNELEKIIWNRFDILH